MSAGFVDAAKDFAIAATPNLVDAVTNGIMKRLEKDKELTDEEKASLKKLKQQGKELITAEHANAKKFLTDFDSLNQKLKTAKVICNRQHFSALLSLLKKGHTESETEETAALAWYHKVGRAMKKGAENVINANLSSNFPVDVIAPLEEFHRTLGAVWDAAEEINIEDIEAADARSLIKLIRDLGTVIDKNKESIIKALNAVRLSISKYILNKQRIAKSVFSSLYEKEEIKAPQNADYDMSSTLAYLRVLASIAGISSKPVDSVKRAEAEAAVAAAAAESDRVQAEQKAKIPVTDKRHREEFGRGFLAVLAYRVFSEINRKLEKLINEIEGRTERTKQPPNRDDDQKDTNP